MAVAKSKIIETELQSIYIVAANGQKVSSELDLTELGKVSLFIDFAKHAAGAAVGQGTEFAVQVAKKATGNDWTTLQTFTAAITAPTAMQTDVGNNAGVTQLLIGSAVPPVGDIVFFYHYSTLASSEWANIVARGAVGGAEYVYIEDGLAAYQAAGYVYGYAERWGLLNIDVAALTRLRVVANNTKGTTNQKIIWRCSAISAP